ncbi:MAG: peptidylprolyl isomerase [Pseudomonadota bacterium]
MQIEKNHVVTFHYSLSEDGQPLESSEGDDPMACLMGAGNIIPGLEKALFGRAAGDEFSVTLAPADAYGERQPQLLSRMSAKHLGVPAAKLKPGMVLRLHTRRGPQVVRVIKAGRFMVDLDANHPMAGRTLTFEINVVDVRESSAEERAHGRAHGPGGHQHEEASQGSE